MRWKIYFTHSNNIFLHSLTRSHAWSFSLFLCYFVHQFLLGIQFKTYLNDNPTSFTSHTYTKWLLAFELQSHRCQYYSRDIKFMQVLVAPNLIFVVTTPRPRGTEGCLARSVIGIKCQRRGKSVDAGRLFWSGSNLTNSSRVSILRIHLTVWQAYSSERHFNGFYFYYYYRMDDE